MNVRRGYRSLSGSPGAVALRRQSGGYVVLERTRYGGRNQAVLNSCTPDRRTGTQPAPVWEDRAERQTTCLSACLGVARADAHILLGGDTALAAYLAQRLLITWYFYRPAAIRTSRSTSANTCAIWNPWKSFQMSRPDGRSHDHATSLLEFCLPGCVQMHHSDLFPVVRGFRRDHRLLLSLSRGQARPPW